MNSVEIQRDDLLLELVCDLLRGGRRASFVANGSSMHPIIRDGDKVTAAPLAAAEARPGQILLYLAELPDGGRAMVIHRFLGRAPDGNLLLRGDACPLADPPVAPPQVIGRIVEIRRGGWRLSVTGGAGRLFLEGRIGPRLLGGACALRDRLTEGAALRFLPVTHGRLLRERALLELAAGHPEALEELTGTDERIRLDTGEKLLLPILRTRLRESDLDPDAHLPFDAGQVEAEAAVQSVRAEAALRWLAATLEAAQQRLLLVKGAALAWEIYPNPQSRPFADLDALVEPERLRPIVAALLAAGATHAETERDPEYYLRYKNEIALRLPGAGWPVLELHWRGSSTPWYNLRADPRRFGVGSRPSRFGEALRLMRPEAEIVHAVGHLAKHFPSLRLLWALDLALLSRLRPRWGEITDWLIEEKLALPGAVILRWFDDHAPGILPAGITETLARAARKHSGALERWQFYRPPGDTPVLLESWCQPDWFTAAAYFLRCALPPRRDLEAMLPDLRGESLLALHAARWRRRGAKPA